MFVIYRKNLQGKPLATNAVIG
jgi:hypothetical protein